MTLQLRGMELARMGSAKMNAIILIDLALDAQRKGGVPPPPKATRSPASRAFAPP